MLVITRKLNETILINGNIETTITTIHGKEVKIGINAPDDVKILMGELIKKTSSNII